MPWACDTPLSSSPAWCCAEALLCALRRGVSQGDLEEELFIAPLAVPKAPQRFYYKFGRPVRTSRADQNNPERVQQLYQEVQLKPAS